MKAAMISSFSSPESRIQSVFSQHFETRILRYQLMWQCFICLFLIWTHLRTKQKIATLVDNKTVGWKKLVGHSSLEAHGYYVSCQVPATFFLVWIDWLRLYSNPKESSCCSILKEYHTQLMSPVILLTKWPKIHRHSPLNLTSKVEINTQIAHLIILCMWYQI